MTAETRISVVAAGLAAVAAMLAAVLRGWPEGLAWASGGTLSVLNYQWLKAGAQALLPDQGEVLKRGVRSGAFRFLARFGLLGACLCAIFISHLLPFAAVVWGLFAVPLAAVGVAVGQLISDR